MGTRELPTGRWRPCALPASTLYAVSPLACCCCSETTGLANPAPVIQTFFVDDDIKVRPVWRGMCVCMLSCGLWCLGMSCRVAGVGRRGPVGSLRIGHESDNPHVGRCRVLLSRALWRKVRGLNSVWGRDTKHPLRPHPRFFPLTYHARHVPASALLTSLPPGRSPRGPSLLRTPACWTRC